MDACPPLQKPTGSGASEVGYGGPATDAFACLSLGNTLSPTRLPVTVAQLLIPVYIQPRLMNTPVYM